MKSFSSVSEAFQWFLENIYKNLPADQKKGKLTYAWRDFTHNGAISEKRMREILSEFGEIEVKTLVTFKPK
jgi:Ca2+-binding EF-hand superfamily protein